MSENVIKVFRKKKKIKKEIIFGFFYIIPIEIKLIKNLVE